jgi:uroporphyrinogen III methyltransferase/synthase
VSEPLSAHEPQVALVGAGPGNPGLLTVRALACLKQADLVIHDQLVPAALLELAPESAERLCVNELHDLHVERGPLVTRTMIDEARKGRRVVRLKGGDPFIFGRGGEEAEALREAGVSFEIVPGITAAIGAAAFAGIPLTHRFCASAVALVTGHEKDDKTGSVLDWGVLANFPGTLAVYMGLKRLPLLVDDLLRHGKDPATPAAVVQWATTGRHRTVEAPLGRLADEVAGAGLSSPAVVLIGPVVEYHTRLNWFEHTPLLGKRVLVTRPRHQAGEMVERLERLGAVVSVAPAVEVREPADWGPVDRALGRLSEYHWLVFTSVNGVRFFFSRLLRAGRDLRALGSVRLAVIGPATAEALRGYYLEPDLIPREYRSETLAEELREAVRGKRVLLARADRGRDVLRDELASCASVEQVAVYSQVDALDADAPGLREAVEGGLDYITLTSSNIARALIRALPEQVLSDVREGRTQLVSISPVTSAAVNELGLPVAAEAGEYTAGGVVEALLKLARLH